MDWRVYSQSKGFVFLFCSYFSTWWRSILIMVWILEQKCPVNQSYEIHHYTDEEEWKSSLLVTSLSSLLPSFKLENAWEKSSFLPPSLLIPSVPFFLPLFCPSFSPFIHSFFFFFWRQFHVGYTNNSFSYLKLIFNY